MRIIYLPHAIFQLCEREIPKTLVSNSLRNPDMILKGRFGRKIAHKRIGKKLLRIVFEEKNNTLIVITAYYTKPERY